MLVSAVSRHLDCFCFKCTLLCVLSIMRSPTNHVGPFSYSTWQATVETETMISCIENQLLPTSPWLLFPQCLLMAVAVVIRRANPCVLRCLLPIYVAWVVSSESVGMRALSAALWAKFVSFCFRLVCTKYTASTIALSHIGYIGYKYVNKVLCVRDHSSGSIASFACRSWMQHLKKHIIMIFTM